MLLGNFLGVMAAIVYFSTIIPGLSRALYPSFLKLSWVRFLLKKRRETGLISFSLMILHGSWFVWERRLDLTQASTWSRYFYGLSMGLILTILAITSSDWSIKKLKKNWKRVHNLTFLVLFLLPAHIFDKMSVSQNGVGWSIWTGFSFCLSIFFAILFSFRLWNAIKNKKFN